MSAHWRKRPAQRQPLPRFIWFLVGLAIVSMLAGFGVLNSLGVP